MLEPAMFLGLGAVAVWVYVRYPRLVYSSFPAVFILAGLSLSTMRKRLARFAPSAADLACGSILVVSLLYANLDAFGFPQLYWRWFYASDVFWP